MKNKNRTSTETNAASMADIAFLLLIFFMVTTSIVNDKGLDLLLPPFENDKNTAEIHERDLFKILINSNDKLLVENEPRLYVSDLRSDIKLFVLNYGREETLSQSPQKAVVSLKTNRGTSQNQYIKTLDEVKAAYYEIYADELDVPIEMVRNRNLPLNTWAKYEKLRKAIPMNISIAEPE